MKLGLDLRGGVHFLMEVDMETALGKLQEQTMDSLRSDLREKGIPYASVRKADDNTVEIRFRDAATRNDAISYLTTRHRDLVFNASGDNLMRAMMSAERLREAREYAVSKTSISCVTVLTNWVWPSRWYSARVRIASWLSCPVFKTPREPKKFWVRRQRWNSVW